MILNTGMRTDIPAFYSTWFYNRVREGFVMVRNPYYPNQVTRYRITPDTVDALLFCTKNPEPMLDELDLLQEFPQFWFVTITPYGREIEPNVPDKHKVMESFRRLSEKVGKNAVSWRYDPIFITERYSVDYHKRAFREIAQTLKGCTEQVVISFIDLYEKTKKNFPEAREVTKEEREELARSFVETGKQTGMTVRTCCEGQNLAPLGVDTKGCLTQAVLEHAIGTAITPPRSNRPRPACDCVLGNDIGAYNTCPHLCRYCYANYDQETVLQNIRNHDPNSPFLTGNSLPEDVITKAKQPRWSSGQIRMI